MDTLYCHHAESWRRWLSENRHSACEVWLRYYKKHTETASVSYRESLLQALCVGLIEEGRVTAVAGEQFEQAMAEERVVEQGADPALPPELKAGEMLKAGKRAGM
jgi:uncharacterized protein YdeI (YjbR/CyaY-like superfamily)